jgi:hypothetical protein
MERAFFVCYIRLTQCLMCTFRRIDDERLIAVVIAAAALDAGAV